MARVVWKAVVRPDRMFFGAPAGAELLTAREQGDDICVWFRCDPTRPVEVRNVEVCGTGHEGAPDGRYLGSAHFDSGRLVFHVFEPTS